MGTTCVHAVQGLWLRGVTSSRPVHTLVFQALSLITNYPLCEQKYRHIATALSTAISNQLHLLFSDLSTLYTAPILAKANYIKEIS